MVLFGIEYSFPAVKEFWKSIHIYASYGGFLTTYDNQSRSNGECED